MAFQPVSPISVKPSGRSTARRRCLKRYVAQWLWCVIIVLTLDATAVPAEVHTKPRRSQPASTTNASPEITGTIAPEKNGSGKKGAAMAARLAGLPDPAAPDIDPLPTPFELPTASRARMRLCGERWRRMKLSGDAHEEIWRDFATSCLVAKAGSGDEDGSGEKQMAPKTGSELNHR